MNGGARNDGYRVDNAGNVVSEIPATRVNTVTFWISVALPANVEEPDASWHRRLLDSVCADFIVEGS